MNDAKIKNKIILLLIFLVSFNILIWREIVFSKAVQKPEIYFLNIGQGDSQLVILPDGIKILIDGGPNGSKLAEQLSEILNYNDRYIDLVVLSHPQADHFIGLIDVFKHYKVGAFISNGIEGTAKSFKELENAVNDSSAKKVVLLSGDLISYKDYFLKFLSPKPEFFDLPDLNHGSLVILFKAGGASALFTGDIGFEEEDYLARNYDIDVDILKVAHHGSKYSSGGDFLKAVSPKISVIEVGRNSYGHPTALALSRLAAVSSKIFRTDKDGVLKLVIDERKIKVFKNRSGN
ncbi:MAG: MBL fold metallo-hydrolase [Candidatus Brennerbacteria bacterium]|nr:MBL fold metallo-hydrolase [Candidatus Brennerbacteria bacterium]